MIKCRTPAIQTPQKNEHAAAPPVVPDTRVLNTVRYISRQ